MRYLLIIVLMIFNHAKADLLLGLHSDGDKLAYAFQKTIRVMSISKDSILQERILTNDSQLLEGLYQKTIQGLNIKRDSSKTLLRKSIQDFSIVNLTYFNHCLYAGIRFYKGRQFSSEFQYGILRLGETLKTESFYLVKLPTPQAFTMLPYYPLELEDSNHLLMPIIDSGKLCISRFTLDSDKHQALSGRIVKKNIQIGNYIQIFNPGILIDPYLYSVVGTGYDYYFQFPYPVFFKSKDSMLFDLHAKSDVLKVEITPIGAKQGPFLLFDRYVKRDTMVILATHLYQDTLHYLLSSHDPERIYYFSQSVISGSYKFRMIKVPSANHYFLITEKRQIAFLWKDKKASVKIFRY